LVYRPQDANTEQLYVVKRRDIEVYESGHNSYIGPKLYKIGNAKSRCKQNNTQLEREIKSWVPYFEPSQEHYQYCLKHYGQDWVDARVKEQQQYKWELDNGGPWIVAPAVVSCIV
jgi:hypothetical protein